MAALKGVCDLNRQKHILRNLTKVDRMLTQTTELAVEERKKPFAWRLFHFILNLN